MRQYDIIVIGAGSAGIAATIEAYKNGVKNILLLERDVELGGILQQCIHNGFGLHEFKEELSGPNYAERFINMLNECDITVKLDSAVLEVSKDFIVTYSNSKEGYVKVKGKSIIFSTGCYERSRGAISIPGSRPQGVMTAGLAQKYLNIDGYLVGKNVFILGSGDIGLIMARRMVLEGANVLGVAEIMPYSNGLARNIVQCLEDYDIPLYLSHTITNIKGKHHLEEITLSKVDEKLRPIEGTEKTFKVDTLLLSVGLIPENRLLESLGVKIDQVTKGAVVNESLETSVKGVFACGNALHVHDLVDYVSEEGRKAGIAAANFIKNNIKDGKEISLKAENGIRYTVPQKIRLENIDNKLDILFRVDNNYKDVIIDVYKDGEIIKSIKKRHLAPAEMERLPIKLSDIENVKESIIIKIRGDK